MPPTRTEPMSIAVTAVIRPSRRLRAMLCALALLHAAVAAGLATGMLGNFHFRPWLAAAHSASGAAFLLAALRRQKPRRVDVCGRGRIRLTVQQDVDPRTANAALLGASTLWPALLVLLLRDQAGAAHAVAVLPDALAPDPYRRLAVALRSVAARGRPATDPAKNRLNLLQAAKLLSMWANRRGRQLGERSDDRSRV